MRSRGIDLKPHGNGHLVGLCPFHDDTGTPNLVVTPGKGLFHCLACGAAGNGTSATGGEALATGGLRVSGGWDTVEEDWARFAEVWTEAYAKHRQRRNDRIRDVA